MDILPQVGEKCSYRVGSDTYPCTVVRVSKTGRKVIVRDVVFTAGEGHNYYENQVWAFVDDGKGHTHTFNYSSKKNGWFGCGRLIRNGWEAYQDPCF
jgi:hypothetical protein